MAIAVVAVATQIEIRLCWQGFHLAHSVPKLFTSAEHYPVAGDNRTLANCAAFLVVANAHRLARSTPARIGDADHGRGSGGTFGMELPSQVDDAVIVP